MPMWVLVCKNCYVEFQHTQVSDVGMFLYYVSRPLVPPEGHQRVCPKCGFKGKYEGADLVLRDEMG